MVLANAVFDLSELLAFCFTIVLTMKMIVIVLGWSLGGTVKP